MFLFYGARPAWRTFASGMSDGPDVRELEAEPGRARLREPSTSPSTTRSPGPPSEAIRALADEPPDRPSPGSIALGRVVFEPDRDARRRQQRDARHAEQPGQAMLTATSPARSSPSGAGHADLPRAPRRRGHGHHAVRRRPAPGTSSICCRSWPRGCQFRVSPAAPAGRTLVSVPALDLDHRSGCRQRLDQAPVTVQCHRPHRQQRARRARSPPSSR